MEQTLITANVSPSLKRLYCDEENKDIEELSPLKSLRTRGQVLVNKLPGRFAKDPTTGKAFKWPVVEGFKNINCTSGGQGIWWQLSPMYLGPIMVSEWGWSHATDYGEKTFGIEMPLQATCLENLWQYSKCWSGEDDPATNQPEKVFFERRAKGWRQEKGQRHVKKGAVTLYSLWGTEHLTYIEARRRIYFPIYSELVKKTEAYKKLEALLDDGTSIQLLEFDAYPLGDKTWKECFEDASRSFGHGMVLACVLQGLEPWK